MGSKSEEKNSTLEETQRAIQTRNTDHIVHIDHRRSWGFNIFLPSGYIHEQEVHTDETRVFRSGKQVQS